MNKYLDKKHTKLLIFACWLVYSAVTMARLTYSASMVAIISELGITQSSAGLVLSGFALTYGAGQLVNGLLCKYYNPKIVVALSLFVSSVMTFLLPIAGNVTVMVVLWVINGCAQSTLWSLLIRTLSVYLDKGYLGHAIVVISTTTAVGTALAYGISAVFVALHIWQFAFYTSAVVLALVAVVWMSVMNRLVSTVDVSHNTTEPEIEEKSKRKVSSGFVFVLALMCVSALSSGFVRDGVNSWLPKLLTDEFSVSESISIILTLLLPLFSILGAIIARNLYNKYRNHQVLNSIFFASSAVLAALVWGLYSYKSLAITVILFIGVACAMSASNNVVVAMFPLDNREFMDSGALAGILDTMCYVGSAFAGTAIGSAAENCGWTSVFAIFLVFSVVTAVISLAASFVKTK